MPAPMWQVDNRTPFAAQGYFVRDRAGAEHWTFAVRARFVVLPNGLVAVADEQRPVRLAPDYVAEDALELAAESGFAHPDLQKVGGVDGGYQGPANQDFGDDRRESALASW